MSGDRAAAEARFEEGGRHLAVGETREAEACFREALGLDPGFAEAHANLGLLLDETGRREEAEQCYRRALALNPCLGKTWSNLGLLLAVQKRFGEAEAAHRRALALSPDSAVARSNLGVLQACRQREDEAERTYRTALALDPSYRPASFNLGCLLLRQGRYEEGWRRFEGRSWYAHLERHLPCPRWRGEPLQGRSIVVGFEAGHGDMIQFCRYVPVLKARGAARIDLICHPALQRLFTTLAGVDTVFPFDAPIPDGGWDFWTPPMSAPYYCRTRLHSIPAAIPYLRADGELLQKWAALLAPAGLFRVGLAWKGNPRFENDADRSLPSLEELAPLGRIGGVRFFSLQKGAGEEEAASPPAGLPVTNLAPGIADFADLAAITAQLDLVVCVDTAVAHLAGALGTPCWVLLPDYMTDWRWLEGRTDSPWYPVGMRLFRQRTMGDWGPVVAGVAASLRRLRGEG